MPVTFDDDPEILWDPSTPPAVPSAPPAELPIAVATPLPSNAPSTPSPGNVVERTTNPDGSLAVEITTTRHMPDGYREVKVEYFRVPADAADAIATSLDAGESPSNLYMTKMEQQVLPPGTGAVVSRPSNQPSTPAQHQFAATGQVPVGPSSWCSGPRACAIGCAVICLVIIISSILSARWVSSHASSSHASNNWTPTSSDDEDHPSFDDWSPSPYWPADSPVSWSHPSPRDAVTYTPNVHTTHASSPSWEFPRMAPNFRPSTREKERSSASVPAFPSPLEPPRKSDSFDGNPNTQDSSTSNADDESKRDRVIVPSRRELRDDTVEKQ